MRLTVRLCRQHLGRMFKAHWKLQGRQTIRDTGAAKQLEALGISVVNALDVVKEEQKRENWKFIGYYGGPQEEKLVRRHNKLCYVYRDHNVLLEGLEQAKLLTKTVEIQDDLPEVLKNPPDTSRVPDLHEIVKKSVLKSHVYNATQDLLPRVKDPARPAYNFPRVMGIPVSRSSSLLCTNLFHLSEAVAGRPLGMMSVGDSFFGVPLEKEGDSIQLEVTADFLLMASRPLSPVADAEAIRSAEELPLPDLHPIKHTITLEKERACKINDVFPVDAGSSFSHVHTAIVFYDQEKVHNLFGTPVTEKQILGRSLMYSFAIAAAQARHNFGAIAEDLPLPITVQCIQTDSKVFYFSIFQLNTLQLDGVEGTKNLLWMLPKKSLFDSCCYAEGIPTLTGYNPDVFNTFLALCANEQ